MGSSARRAMLAANTSVERPADAAAHLRGRSAAIRAPGAGR